MRFLGARIVAVGVFTAAAGSALGTVCTGRVFTSFGSTCIEYGNGVGGIILASGVVIMVLGGLLMVVWGEFRSLPRTEQGGSGAAPTQPVPRPQCPVCGEPLVRVLEHERWYCLTCKDWR